MSDKLPVPKNEKERLKALDGYDIMDSLDEAEFDRLTKLASLICGVPIALVSLVDENRQWFKSKVGLDAPETPRDISFCQYAIVGDELFQVEDATKDKRFKDNPLVTDAPDIKFYAGYPLLDPNGFALGTLCVIDRKPKKLDANQIIALELLSQEVVSQIVSRKNKLERNELDKLFEVSVDMICVAGVDGFFKKINPAFSNILGWSDKDLLGKPFFDLIHPEDLTATKKIVKEISKGVIVTDFKNRFRTKNGDYLLINWHANPDPETGKMYSIGRDVTESENNLKRVEVESEIISVISRNKPVEETLENIMRVVCDFLDWKVGCVWSADEDRQVLINPKIKNFSKEKVKKFIAATENITFDIGIGLPGRVLKAGKSAWVLDVTKDKNFPRAKSADADNLHAGFCFPIKIGKDIPFVIEFFSNEILNANEQLLRIFDEIGVLIGTYLKNKRIEEQLNQSYHFQNTVLDGTDYSIIATELDGTISIFNQGAEELLGYCKEEVVGKTSPAIFHDLDEVVSRAEVLSKELKTPIEPGFGVFVAKTNLGIPDVNDWTYITKAGKRIPMEISVSALFDENKEISGYLGMGKNLTESKKKSKEVEQLKNALDESAIVATTDAKGKIINVNDLFCKISGYSRKELIGQDHRIINSGFHSKQFMKNLWTTIKAGKIWTGEIKNKAKDDSIYWVDTTIVPFLDDNGKPIQFIAIRNDITIAKTLSEKLDIELKAINNSVLRVELDSTGKILDCNSHFLDLLGYTQQEIIKMNHKDLTSDEVENQAEYKEFWKNLNKGESQHGEYKRITKNGNPIWIRGSYMPIIAMDGKVEKVIKLAYDVTETVLMQNQLEVANKVAEESTKAKDEFLANMSHEIRTPMNAIVGFTELLDSTETTNEQKEYLESIQTASRSLLTIINDILDFAKIGSGKLAFNDHPFLLNDTLGHVKKTLASLANKKNIKLQFYTDTDINKYVLADEGRLNQVLINLIGNSIKFTEEGKIEVFSSLVNETDDNYLIKFLIKDTGIGIKKDKLEHIFSRFKQAENYTTRKYGGTGLGLSISKTIIELFGGELEVASEFGKGSEFYFTIDFKKSKDSIVKDGGVKSTEKRSQSLKNTNVLLIEDNQLNQLLVKNFLAKEGVNLVMTMNGQEGVEKLSASKDKFDVVLMDLQMPVMNGYDATTFIREELKSDVPIIAMTAHSLVGEKQKCMDLGMNEYISKPYTQAELLSKIALFVNNGDLQEDVTDSKNDLLEKIKELGGNDDNFTKEIVSIFLKNGQHDVSLLEKAYENKDFEKLKSLAHKLRSSFGMFGLTKGYDLLTNLELDNYKNNEEMEGDVEAFKIIASDTFKELKNIN